VWLRLSSASRAMKFRIVFLGQDGDEGESPESVRATAQAPCGDDGIRYGLREAGMVRVELRKSSRGKITTLTNFAARITADLIIDDGEQENREFEFEALLDGEAISFSIPAAEFGRMDWVAKRLGPRAIVYPGQQQHTRAAIQSLSGPIPQKRIFAQTGWRKIGSDWVYLHGGGALGATDPSNAIQVRLPSALESYRLEFPHGSEQANAVRASLRFLDVAPDRISIPLLAAVYRASLGNTDFSVFVTGKSGVFKSSLAALCQQHFGAGMNAGHLPANFASTPAAIQWLAFQAKDALLVVDDFAPTGRSSDQHLHSLSESIFRAAGNHQGRNRMAGANGLSAVRPPRALLLATGEQVPQDASIRARQLIIDLQEGDVNRSRLSECQRLAHDGQFAAAVGAFISWIAPQI
jgi:hypothetical protein